MRLEPFVRVDEIAFATSIDEILDARGTPTRTCRNGVGLHELDYGDVVFRFQDCGRLEEISMRASVIDFGNVAVPFAALESFVHDHDPAWFERAGFVVSPRYGLAFVPADAPWVTALAAHCLDAWRAL
jgi:hypothetical protein